MNKTTHPLRPAADKVGPFAGAPDVRKTGLARRRRKPTPEVAPSIDPRVLRQENAALLPLGRKRCSRCARVKRLKCFSRNGEGYQSRCKLCRAATRRGRWAEGPELVRQQRKYREKKVLENRDPSIPLLVPPRLTDSIIREDLDAIVAESLRHFKNRPRPWSKQR